MTASQRLYLPFEQVFTNLGAIGAGWKIHTYLTNTSTPKATYSDTALTVPNTNPIVADSAGRLPNIYGSSATLYKFVLADENDNVIETRDPVDPQTFTLANFNPQPASYWGTTEGTSTAYTLASTVNIADIGYQNNQIFLITFHATCGASPTLNIDGLGALNLKKYLSDGTQENLEAGDVLGGERYWATNNGANIVVLNTVIVRQASETVAGISYLPNQITIANNIADINTKIDFGAGNFDFEDGSGQATVAAMTKILQASGSWAAGNGQNGLDTGARANNTMYYTYSIYNPTTGASDEIISANASSPSLPSGYTKYKQIINGQFKTDGSGNIMPFVKQGRVHVFKTYIQDYFSNTPSGTNQFQSVSVPVMNNITANIKAYGATGTGGVDILSVSFAGNDTNVSLVPDINSTGDASRYVTVYLSLPTNNGYIKFTVFASANTRQLTILTRGWTDNN